MKSDFVELGPDRYGRSSSLPQITRGPNRGRRKPEKGGRWVYVGGYVCEHGRHTYERAAERAAHYSWAEFLVSLGFRVGKRFGEGTVGFYVWILTP